MRKTALYACLSWLGAAICWGDFSGTVTRVLDGDTLVVTDKHGPQEIRLHWADAPEIAHRPSEIDQPYGQKAKAFTATALGTVVRVRQTKDRSYGRIVGQVFLDDGADLGLNLVRSGLAWVDPRFAPPAEYRQATDSARAGHIGLWRDSNPIPPWTWRRTHQAEHHDATSLRFWRRHRRRG